MEKIDFLRISKAQCESAAYRKIKVNFCKGKENVNE